MVAHNTKEAPTQMGKIVRYPRWGCTLRVSEWERGAMSPTERIDGSKTHSVVANIIYTHGESMAILEEKDTCRTLITTNVRRFFLSSQACPGLTICTFHCSYKKSYLWFMPCTDVTAIYCVMIGWSSLEIQTVILSVWSSIMYIHT